MVDRVRETLSESAAGDVYAVTSPNAPETAAWVGGPRIETPGEGYVRDLQAALADDRITQPVLTVVADLPLLSAATVDEVLAAHDHGSLTVTVPVGRVSALGFSVDTAVRHDGSLLSPAGVNVVAPGEEAVISRRSRELAANVNRPPDLAAARWVLAGKSQSR